MTIITGQNPQLNFNDVEVIYVEERKITESCKLVRYIPTSILRWFLPKRTDVSGLVPILQQKWVSEDNSKFVWQDVPTENE